MIMVISYCSDGWVVRHDGDDAMIVIVGDNAAGHTALHYCGEMREIDIISVCF